MAKNWPGYVFFIFLRKFRGLVTSHTDIHLSRSADSTGLALTADSATQLKVWLYDELIHTSRNQRITREDLTSSSPGLLTTERSAVWELD